MVPKILHRRPLVRVEDEARLNQAHHLLFFWTGSSGESRDMGDERRGCVEGEASGTHVRAHAAT